MAVQYVALRGAEARLAVLRRNREAVARGEAIAQRREAQGAATRYDAATAGTQLAAVEAAIPAAEQEVAAHRNALALLAGEEPHALDTMLAAAQPAVPVVPVRLPGGLPSALARSRPDILAAEAQLTEAIDTTTASGKLVFNISPASPISSGTLSANVPGPAWPQGVPAAVWADAPLPSPPGSSAKPGCC